MTIRAGGGVAESVDIHLPGSGHTIQGLRTLSWPLPGRSVRNTPIVPNPNAFGAPSPSADNTTNEPPPLLGEEGARRQLPTFPSAARGW